MADEPSDVLDLDEGMVLDPDEGLEQQDDEQGDDEAVVTFGDEAAESEPAPTDLVKHLRKENRKLHEQIAQSSKAPVEEPIVVGEEPDIEDFDWDKDRWRAEHHAWQQRGRDKEKQDEQRERQKLKEADDWQNVLKTYAEKKAALPFRDKDSIEARAFEVLNAGQQSIIAKVASNPALFIYGAGKHDGRLNALAASDDAIVFAYNVGKMEAGLKIGKRSQAPEPEQVLRGSTVSNNSDKREAELLKKAQASNNMDEYRAYMRDKRKA